ncbi:hypothetical protein Prudu_021147 [Prunus dulcis]|uniref:Integrase catalytic domain-containing protein n=1 Tax=Prunus dulcis TaxID=3755 RepID=A0A4Y1RWQ7_PRUDU|nr:hypothetical protein Prudu_021147 [Prunus dulcis]
MEESSLLEDLANSIYILSDVGLQIWSNSFQRSNIVPECQICCKRGHTAANCYFRHDTSTAQGSARVIECQICGKRGHGALDCYQRSNYSYQGQPPSPKISAMTAQSAYTPNQVWIADSGASHHMVADVSSLHHVTPVNLQNMLQWEMVKDKRTRKILLRGLSHNGIYPIPCTLPSQSRQWHFLDRKSVPPCGIEDLAIPPMTSIHSDVWGPSHFKSLDGYRYFVSFLDECTGILHQVSCPYTPQQNGMAERKNRHIIETAITMLTEASLPGKFWFHATAHAAYLINRMPSSTLDNQLPVYPYLRHYNVHKLQPRTTKCVFLGYATGYKGVIGYNCATAKCVISRDVIHDESVYPFVSPITPQQSSTSSSACFSDQQLQAILPYEASSPLPLPPNPEPVNTHAMQTRSKSVSRLSRLFHLFNCWVEPDAPYSYKVASYSAEWRQAMQEEIEALQSQGTWSLEPNPGNKNIVGSKWLYKIKKNSDGSVARYKARLVAQGFSQQPGLDFGETFSPVVRHTTVRLVLSLAAMNQWSLRQLDVKNAFLHGDLEEEVFMRQPQGYEDPAHPEYVCKLKKSLYGLKQAPRAWNAKFTGYLPALGFKISQSDPSLFVKHEGSDVIMLLLYVDDIILTGSNADLVQSVVDNLSSVFEMKDMGRLAYFLGLQIAYPASGGLFVSQTKYAKDLLHKAGMQSCRACSTPCKPHNQILTDCGEPLSDPTMFRSVVGALQYLTFTRPDLAYAVNTVCQYMNNPTDVHWLLVKRILRYVQGTLCLASILRAYSDADWAGDINTRRSTTGFVVFLGPNPISWQSKKQGSVSRSSTEAEQPSDKQVIGVKWVFKTKLNLDGSVQKNKARLVAKGYVQKPGIDYRNNQEMLNEFKKDMKEKYEMTDLGLLHHFLGMGVIQTDSRIFIHQRKYASSLLNKFGLNDCKPVSTHLVATEKLIKDDGSGAADEEKYRKLVGSLLYLTATRPDVMYAASLLARYMHGPSNKHYGTAKRVLRYVQGTLDYGLMYEKGKKAVLVGYCDSDWGGSIKDSKSTSGYAFSFGSGVFSWASVKQSCVALSTAEAEYVSAS